MRSDRWPFIRHRNNLVQVYARAHYLGEAYSNIGTFKFQHTQKFNPIIRKLEKCWQSYSGFRTTACYPFNHVCGENWWLVRMCTATENHQWTLKNRRPGARLECHTGDHGVFRYSPACLVFLPGFTANGCICHPLIFDSTVQDATVEIVAVTFHWNRPVRIADMRFANRAPAK